MCVLKRSFSTHYITGNLIHPISNLSVTLDNVSYYIMNSGAYDFSEQTLCKLQLFFCSVSQGGTDFKMHVRFAITLGTHSLGGVLAHLTATHSLKAEFYTLIQNARRSRFQSLTREASKSLLCFHFLILDTSFVLQSAVRYLA